MTAAPPSDAGAAQVTSAWPQGTPACGQAAAVTLRGTHGFHRGNAGDRTCRTEPDALRANTLNWYDDPFAMPDDTYDHAEPGTVATVTQALEPQRRCTA